MATKKDLISIIIPCYNEQESLPIFYHEMIKIAKEMATVDYEFLFIDDGSRDKTLSILRKLSETDKRVRYISFSRNFGKEAGIYAGLSNAEGDYVAIMDADLQDPPSKLKEMYNTIKKKEYDCVALYTSVHKDYSLFRRLLTNIWYKIADSFSKTKQKPGARDFRLMTKQMVEALLSMTEYNRFTKGMFSYIGFKTKWLEYETPNRVAGDTKFNLKSLTKYAMEGLVSFSTTPLIISLYLGITFILISSAASIALLTRSIILNSVIFSLPMIGCMIVFFSGIQLLFFGIVGIYLSKLYTEVKQRPVYIIKETEKSNKKGGIVRKKV